MWRQTSLIQQGWWNSWDEQLKWHKDQVDWRKEDRKVMFGAKMPVLEAGPASLTSQQLGKESISSCRSLLTKFRLAVAGPYVWTYFDEPDNGIYASTIQGPSTAGALWLQGTSWISPTSNDAHPCSVGSWEPHFLPHDQQLVECCQECPGANERGQISSLELDGWF